MKDIYELKAQKYKLKYEKLLQELAGGAFQQTLQQIKEKALVTELVPVPLTEFEKYQLAQQKNPELLPEQTFDDYLRTKAQFEKYKITQLRVPSVLINISSYLDFMLKEEELRRNNPILRQREEQEAELRRRQREEQAEFEEYQLAQQSNPELLPEQTFDDYLRTKAQFEEYSITQLRAPYVFIYISSYLDFMLKEEERRHRLAEFQEYQLARQRNPELLPEQTFDDYFRTKAQFEEYKSKQLLAPNLLAESSTYLHFMQNSTELLTRLEEYLQTRADYESYILSLQQTQQPIISYEQFLEIRARNEFRRLSRIEQNLINSGRAPIFGDNAKIVANQSAILQANNRSRQ